MQLNDKAIFYEKKNILYFILLLEKLIKNIFLFLELSFIYLYSSKINKHIN